MGKKRRGKKRSELYEAGMNKTFYNFALKFVDEKKKQKKKEEGILMIPFWLQEKK